MIMRLKYGAQAQTKRLSETLKTAPPYKIIV